MKNVFTKVPMGWTKILGLRILKAKGEARGWYEEEETSEHLMWFKEDLKRGLKSLRYIDSAAIGSENSDFVHNCDQILEMVRKWSEK